MRNFSESKFMRSTDYAKSTQTTKKLKKNKKRAEKQHRQQENRDQMAKSKKKLVPVILIRLLQIDLYNKIKSMDYWKLFILVLALQVAQITTQGSTHRNFLQWKQQHAKNYMDQTQELYRFYVYSQNLQRIKAHNNDASRDFKLGVNQFSDLTWQEFQNSYLSMTPPSPAQVSKIQKNIQNGKTDNLKQEVDEKDHPIIDATSDHKVKAGTSCVFKYDFSQANLAIKSNQLIPVQNQGKCAAGYAFATAATLGSAAAIKYDITYIPSAQQIVSCTSTDMFGNAGCNGGWFNVAYDYGIMTNIADIDRFPYSSLDGNVGPCLDSTERGPVSLASYGVIQESTADATCGAMKNFLKTRPMAVYISVSDLFLSYKSGVLDQTSCPANGVNHGVYLVGFDSCGNWKIQNSWGTTWGNNGFIILKGGNTCNICSNGGYFPILA